MIAWATQEWKGVLGRVEVNFRVEVPNPLGNNKIQEIVGKVVGILLEPWKQTCLQHEAMVPYKWYFLSQWNLDVDCCARIQNKFVILLLYEGFEVGAPSLGAWIDG